MDPGLAIYDITTMQEKVDEAMAQTRFLTILMGVFSALAVIIAVVGLYGVISYAVRQRTNEIGIRMAFGAERPTILRLVVGRGAKLVFTGLALGLASVVLLGRFIGTLLYGVSATDPVTLTTAALVLAGVALSACYIPARRAAQIDPIEALRAE